MAADAAIFASTPILPRQPLCRSNAAKWRPWQPLAPLSICCHNAPQPSLSAMDAHQQSKRFILFILFNSKQRDTRTRSPRSGNGSPAASKRRRILRNRASAVRNTTASCPISFGSTSTVSVRGRWPAKRVRRHLSSISAAHGLCPNSWSFVGAERAGGAAVTTRTPTPAAFAPAHFWLKRCDLCQRWYRGCPCPLRWRYRPCSWHRSGCRSRHRPRTRWCASTRYSGNRSRLG